MQNLTSQPWIATPDAFATGLASRSILSALLVASLVVVSAPAANAISIQVTELSGCWFTTPPEDFDNCFGSPLTIGIRISETPGEEEIGSIGLSVSSYGRNQFIGGMAVPSFFHDFAEPGIGAFGGFQNLAGGALVESFIGDFGNRVQFALGLRAFGDFPPPPAPPGIDPGLDGVIGGGDSMFLFQFRIFEDAFFRIGTEYFGDGIFNSDASLRAPHEILIDVGTNSIPIVILPEPSTALLLGLGLTALGLHRRRHDA